MDFNNIQGNIMKRYAGIDIGSNTILMTIVETDESGKITIIEDKHEIARLGEKVDQTGILLTQAIERAASILVDYRQICDFYEVKNIRAAATSAMRDASNGLEAASLFSEILGTAVEIIEGNDEASISFLGSIDYSGFNAITPTSVKNERILVIDIGGGSTELIVGSGIKFESSVSINIGSVRITEKYFSSHPPSQIEIEKAKDYIRNSYFDSGFKTGAINKCIAVAGTATTLAAISNNLREFLPFSINGLQLSKEKIKDIFNLLISIPVSEITGKYGVHPKRADVITAGALILGTLADLLDLDNLNVSIQGLRFGLIFDMMIKDNK
jgi:exopolyphosphatase / guanosine-5'-triphosphate,3'-diphosphate pyrophosphatase